MKAFLAAVVATVVIAWAAHWVLTNQLDWSSASRFAAEDAVRLDSRAAIRPGF